MRVSAALLFVAFALLSGTAIAQEGPAPDEARERGKEQGRAEAAEAIKKAENKQGVAEAAAQEAKEQAAEAKRTAADVRSGKLIEYGVTAGVAVGFHTPLPRASGGTGLDTVAVATIPYVMLVPAYIGGDDATNAYCARSWVGGEFSDAADAAKLKARRRSEQHSRRSRSGWLRAARRTRRPSTPSCSALRTVTATSRTASAQSWA